MGSTTHGLAVILIIFERIMIQCEGAPNQTEPNRFENPLNVNIEDTEQMDLIDEITIGEIGQWENPILLMIPYESDNNGSYQFYKNGDLFLVFGSNAKLISFLEIFNYRVKRIAINDDEKSDEMLCEAINIIKKYLFNLDEVRIATRYESRILDELSMERNARIFRTVKKFEYFGFGSKIEFQLNSIFPKLESVKLSGKITDLNCLADLTTLKESDLIIGSVQVDQLVSLFTYNRNMKQVTLSQPDTREIMKRAPEGLKGLNTLYVVNPDGNHVFRINDQALFAPFSLVKNYSMFFVPPKRTLEDIIPAVPLLKMFTLDGRVFRNGFIDFIRGFEEFKNDALILTKSTPDEIEKLRKIFMKKNWVLTRREDIRAEKEFLMFKREKPRGSTCIIS